MINITSQRLRDLLSSAYEEGWAGSLEFKNEYVEQVLDRLSEHMTLVNSSIQTISASSGIYLDENSPTSIPGYYSYFGQTSPIETVWVNNSDEEPF